MITYMLEIYGIQIERRKMGVLTFHKGIPIIRLQTLEIEKSVEIQSHDFVLNPTPGNSERSERSFSSDYSSLKKRFKKIILYYLLDCTTSVPDLFGRPYILLESVKAVS